MTRLADLGMFSRSAVATIPGVVEVHAATPEPGHVLLVVERHALAEPVRLLAEAWAPIGTPVHVQVEGEPPIAAWTSARQAEQYALVARKRHDVLWAFRSAEVAAGNDLAMIPDGAGRVVDVPPHRRGGWLTTGEVHALMGGSHEWKVYASWLDALAADGVLVRRSAKSRMWRLTDKGRAELAASMGAGA